MWLSERSKRTRSNKRK